MVEQAQQSQRRELGVFVRACRERLQPADFGLAAGTRRRTPGLRREEAAMLAGLSTTWVSWIEQGRDVSLSARALARLAGALRLSRAERAYMFELAGKRDPARGGSPPEDVPPVLNAAVAAIAVPAYVLDRLWNARAWNVAAARLFAGWLDRGDTAPNLLRFLFLEPAARIFISDWPVRARRVVAEFRADSSAWRDDPALAALVDGLRQQSADFARLWDAHDVLEREGGLRRFAHPRDGELCYEQVSFQLSGHPDLKLTMLVPQS